MADDLIRAARELEQQRSNERIHVVNELKQSNDAVENARELTRQARTEVPAALAESRDRLVEECRRYEQAAKQAVRDARKNAEQVWTKSELQQLGLVSSRSRRPKDSSNENGSQDSTTATDSTVRESTEDAATGVFTEDSPARG